MYKTNRLNHDFQIAYFIAGKNHTPDGMYGSLLDLKESREMAIAEYDINVMRNDIKRNQIMLALEEVEGDDKKLLKIELIELDHHENIGSRNYKCALDELSFINKCIDKVNPLRKYKHLPDNEANELAQKEEWKLELINRAENMLLTTGCIATDHFVTMRLHPDFKSDILPEIVKVDKLLNGEDGYTNLLNYVAEKDNKTTKLLEFKGVEEDGNPN